MNPSTGFDHEFFVQWHLTERCNLRCRHCYQGDYGARELTLAEISAVADEVRETVTAWEAAHAIDFSKSFSITGGEPLLRNDLFEILALARGTEFSVFLLSNGTLIGSREARRLADLGVAAVQVSVEGPEPVHDRIRGGGTFAAAARGTRALVDEGVPVHLNVTLSRLNAFSTRESVALAAELGARRIAFSRLVPCGRGAEFGQDMLTPREVKGIYDELFSLEVAGLEIASGDPLASQLRAGAAAPAGCTAVGGCAAGVCGLTILPDGAVSPCRRLDLTIGDLRTDSLRELWATSPVLEALRDKARYRGRCGACDRWAHCRGCRAVAYAYSSAAGAADFLADDPQCFL